MGKEIIMIGEMLVYDVLLHSTLNTQIEAAYKDPQHPVLCVEVSL